MTNISRGWHFLQIPGPSNTPERIRRAMSMPTIDHRGPEFGALTRRILERLPGIFRSTGKVVIYPSSGTGAWEAAMMNLFNPGDQILAYETGHFAVLWKKVAERIGLKVVWLEGDWRRGIVAERVADVLRQDGSHAIKGVMAIHNETSNGVTSDLAALREGIDSVGHPALLLVDVVSSLGTTDFRQDDWKVDVAICASQKGFMMPPGLGFNSLSRKAMDASVLNDTLHSYWQWQRILDMNETGFFPYTPGSSLLMGLDVALDMLCGEGLDAVIARHAMLSETCRVAADHWGLENQCWNPSEYSNCTTALRIPEGYGADDLRKYILREFNMSLGSGLGQLKNQVFRLGHLGDLNELMLMAMLAGTEMGMQALSIPHRSGGVQAAMDHISQHGMTHSSS